jgi:hypothetical protein
MVVQQETIAIFGAKSVIRSCYPFELDSPPLFEEAGLVRRGLFSDEEPLDFNSIAPRWWPCATEGFGDRSEKPPQ